MSHPNPSTAEAFVLIDELARNGVTDVVLAPGSRSAALALEAAAHSAVRLHVEVDERSAGFFALGIARASGEPAAVVTTSGTAAVNLHPAVVEASTDRVPMLVVTADRPDELRDVGANQTIDQAGLYGSAVRWYHEIGVAEDRADANAVWRSTVCRAVAEAYGSGAAPGPVHLNLPFREPLVPEPFDGRARAEPFENDTDGRPGGRPWTARIDGGPGSVSLPEEWVERERCLVVVGRTGVRDPAWRPDGALDGWAARMGWPLVAEPQAGARPPQTVTAAHHLLGHSGFRDRFLPDGVIAVGRVGLSRAVSGVIARVPYLVIDPWGWPDLGRRAETLMAGWPSGEFPTQRTSGWRRAWMRAEAVVREARNAVLDSSDAISEPRVARDLVRALSSVDRATLVVGSSMPIRDVDLFGEPAATDIVANRGASGIDGFVSTALGVAAASDGPVVGLTGDLGMLHDAGALLVDPRPDAVLVVVDNDGGGIFSFLPQARFPEHFEQVFGTPHGRDLRDLAEFHRAGYRKVDTASGIVGAVHEAVDVGGVQIIHARTDRDANVEIHRAIESAVARALDRWLDSAEAGPGA